MSGVGRRTPTFRQVEAFRAAAQLQTATAAAHALGLGQPAVSRLLAEFERSVGLSLFDRRGRGLALTADGELLRQEVERTFIGLEAIAEAASAIGRNATGLLRVAALQAYADGFVADAVGDFLREYPGLRVELQSVPKPELIRLLAMERYDLGIASLPVDSPALVAKPLVKRRGVMLFPASLLPPEVVTWPDLERLPLIVLSRDAPFRVAFDAQAAHLGIRPRIVAELRTQRAVCRAAMAGGGVGLVEDVLAYEYDMERSHTRPLPGNFEWTLALLQPRRRKLTRSAQGMARLLAARAAEHHLPA
jgi:DNA-binding transcriptional LysR family regulator